MLLYPPRARWLIYVSLLTLAFVGCSSDGGNGPKPATPVTEPRIATAPIDILLDVPLRVVLAQGPGGLSTVEAADVLSRATATLERQLPVRFHIASFEAIPEPIPELRHPESQELLLSAWEAWAHDQGISSKDSVTVILVPPYEAGGEYLFGGIANGTCSMNRRKSVVLAAVGAATRGEHPESRIEKSAKSIAHELTHVLGGGHTDDESLMAPVFSFDVTAALSLNATSIAQVANCIG